MKVLDFGVARVIGQPPLTRVGEEIIGTPEFIAPEMMSASGELSPSVDLYALGIMLHDTVVGEPPWKGDLKEILHGHMNAVPPRLSERRRDALIPRELDDLTAQLLEKNPLKRPTASEAVEILTRIRALMPTRSVQLMRSEQPAVGGTDALLRGKETVILPSTQGAPEPLRAETVILPRGEGNATARQAEIEAIDAEIVFEGIEQAILSAARKHFSEEENLEVRIDRETGEVFYGEVPPYSVVVSGSAPSAKGGPSLYCAVIVKRVDEKTRAKTSVNELLRD